MTFNMIMISISFNTKPEKKHFFMIQTNEGKEGYQEDTREKGGIKKS